MKALLARTTAVTMLLVLLGPASAQAHERTASTSLTLRANKTTVDQGEKVKFRGELRSNWDKCRKWKKVTLYRGGTAVASKKTTRSGNFSFVVRINATSNWRVTFAGKEWGRHPHNHACLASSSRTIRIRVRGGDDDVAGAGGGNAVVVAGAGGSAGGGAAVTGSDIAGAASAVVALGAIGLVALFLSRRRSRATTS